VPRIDPNAPIVLGWDDGQIFVLERVLDAHIWQQEQWRPSVHGESGELRGLPISPFPCAEQLTDAGPFTPGLLSCIEQPGPCLGFFVGDAYG
jgi:hypothetical protein